jgi:ketosteroid isomerase-like protein
LPEDRASHTCWKHEVIMSNDEPLPARVKRYFGALDTLDADAVASFFAADATVVLPGVGPIVGRCAIRRALVQFSLDVEELHNAPVQLWTAGDVSVFEADMTLTLGDRTTLGFPVTYIIRWVDGLIEEARVNVYLESRMAVAMSAFDRLRSGDRPGVLSYPNHKSMGRLTPAGRNGNSILRPCPADA